jgi:hypothetical protein
MDVAHVASVDERQRLMLAETNAGREGMGELRGL